MLCIIRPSLWDLQEIQDCEKIIQKFLHIVKAFYIARILQNSGNMDYVLNI